jgi:glycosyltransferase involved in cell wall biosynthesis
MRVLHIYKDYHPVLGGIENHIRLLAREQARRGLEVTVLVTSASARTEQGFDGRVRVIKAGRLATVASTPLSPGLFLWAHRIAADIAHLHFPYPVGEMANLLCGRARRTVITYHSDVVRQRGWLKLYEPFLWRVLRHADRILATNAPYVESSRFLRPLADRTTVVPLGIDVEGFLSAPPEEVARIRQAYGSDALPVLLSVGRLRYYKGIDILIHALREVDAVLLLVGTGPMEEQWRALAVQTGVADRVRFLGEIRDEALPAYYHAADLYVSSASHRSEAFGISLLEAMACGRAVISTELGTGTSFVNLDGVTGEVVPPRDPAALAAAIRGLLADPARRAAFGAAGRERVQKEFPAALMADRVIDVYREVLGEAGA